MDNNQNTQNAKDLILRAKKEEQSSNWFGLLNNDKFEKAAELYEQAANKYKLENKMKEAGDAYILAAESHVKNKYVHRSVENYIKASQAYKTISPQNAIKSLEIIINYYSEGGKFDQAARYQQSIAEIYEKNEEIVEAIVAYDSAAKLFKCESMNSNMSKCLEKAGKLLAFKGSFIEAIERYEEASEAILDRDILCWKCNDYYFSASLCALAIGDFQEAQDKIISYIHTYHRFGSSKEGILVVKLTDVAIKSDVRSFVNILVAYNSISPLDDFQTFVLNKTKDHIKEQGDDVL